MPNWTELQQKMATELATMARELSEEIDVCADPAEKARLQDLHARTSAAYNILHGVDAFLIIHKK